MILPDLNLLLYAYNPHAHPHEAARNWWENALNAGELIGIPHEVTRGFIRIATNPKPGNAVISLQLAKQIVETWHSSPSTRVLLPSENHPSEVIRLLEQSRSSGQLTSDASLVVYAIQNRATLCSNDSDFARFPRLDWENPLTSN